MFGCLKEADSNEEVEEGEEEKMTKGKIERTHLCYSFAAF